MSKKLSIFSIAMILVVFFISGSAFAFSYFLTSVWNERKSYDPNYFSEGVFNDITVGIVLEDFSGDVDDLDYQVAWPMGAITDTVSIPFKLMFYGQPAFSAIIGNNVTSFHSWEDITYDITELNGAIPQPPDIYIAAGNFEELPTPTITNYDPSTHSIIWENSYSPGEITNFRVRIYGSIDTDDILFDSGGIQSSESTYTFTDSSAIALLEAGAIFGIAVRKIKSSTEFENTSIYVTRSLPWPCPGDIDTDGDVDGSDLATFAADFGRTNCDAGSPCEGDFDTDNDVDGSDLALFAADFGRTDCP